MKAYQALLKRTFDIIMSILGIIFLMPLMLFLILIASLSTNSIGLFKQERVGKHGECFFIFKVKSMKDNINISTSVTVSEDIRITRFGRFIRNHKLDEILQLFNVLIGDMSFVGPRPDVAGFADLLQGDDRIVLSIRPGITGPASLYFRDEERLLSKQQDPEMYNRYVIWPQKVAINKDYIRNYRIAKDFRYILMSVGITKYSKEELLNE